ncbi:MAG: hypothetical protein NC548_26845, partial [Lachnospiraceae bacterium]|nr:hypothetical protein [Lachnospiraceae bacterium]
MKRISNIALLLGVVFAMTACGQQTGGNDTQTTSPAVEESGSTPVPANENQAEPAENSNQNTEKDETDMNRNENLQTIEQTGWTKSVPSEYFASASEQGSVVPIDYAAKDYAGNGADITKTAYVYLPYGYDENDAGTRYNILYLMHGWGGSAGEYFASKQQRNLFDNLIEKGDIPPLIIVSASFYHDGSDRGFSSSITAFRAFHNEFENDL